MCVRAYPEVSNQLLAFSERRATITAAIMLNDSEFATLRNRFNRDAEFLMQTATSSDEDEKSKLR